MSKATETKSIRNRVASELPTILNRIGPVSSRPSSQATQCDIDERNQCDPGDTVCTTQFCDGEHFMNKDVKAINYKCCIYCGGVLRGIRKGEHIIPDALGSKKSIRCVCNDCNNSFSELDNHLITCSPVCLVDYRHRMTKGGKWYDVDHEDENLILEARPSADQKTWRLWPQIIFCERGTQIRGDYEEVESVGWETWQEIFFKNLCATYERHKVGEKNAILFETNPGMSLRGGYPPRVFAEKPIKDFGTGMRFRARYEHQQQRQGILAHLDKLTHKSHGKDKSIAIGSHAPGAHLSGDAIKTYRALTKIAINALASYCERTEVDRHAFRWAIEFVRYQLVWTRPKRYMARCGFVRPGELRSLGCPQDAHLLRLCHYKLPQLWEMYFVFFGGDICGRIEFPGPNLETWATATMIAPFRGDCKDWKCTTSTDIVDPDVSIVSWEDDEFLRRIVPSVSPIIRESGDIKLERKTRRR